MCSHFDALKVFTRGFSVHILSMFILLGIGADDVFVFVVRFIPHLNNQCEASNSGRMETSISAEA
jgi:hypothetical protein